jgi:hypothetical protein
VALDAILAVPDGPKRRGIGRHFVEECDGTRSRHASRESIEFDPSDTVTSSQSLDDREHARRVPWVNNLRTANPFLGHIKKKFRSSRMASLTDPLLVDWNSNQQDCRRSCGPALLLCQVPLVLEAGVDGPGELSFEAAEGFAAALALGLFAGQVGARGLVHAGLGDRDPVEGAVELPVAAAVEPVTTVLA